MSQASEICGWLVLIAGLVAGDAMAALPAAGLADCDAAESSRILLASHAPADARAVWLDSTRLRWPGKSDSARLKLYRSLTGVLQVAIGQKLISAYAGMMLETSTVRLDRDRQWRWLGEGAERRLPSEFTGDPGEWLKGDLLLVEEDAQGRVRDATRVQLAAALDARYALAEGQRLGYLSGEGRNRFRLWAPTAQSVALCRYATDRGKADAITPLRRDPGTGSWSTTVTQDYRGQYYTYLVEVFVPGTGWVRNRVTDPYSISLGVDSQRSYIADLDDSALKPAGWDASGVGKQLAANTDAVIYELHVRDFSRDDVTVPVADRGKYRAFTHAEGAGMRHLRRLAKAGLTDVHLLPVYDFASVPEHACVTPAVPNRKTLESIQAAVMAVRDSDCFNWGYDPMHYGAPEGSYASDAGDGATRVREFRAMVMALHGAGLRVGMDVVYNHTFAAGQDPRSVLDRIVPGYYHRLDGNGRITHSTCCENTATEHRMMAKLMIDTARRWVRDYRIDSFRFDLMGHQPRAVMEKLQAKVNRAGGRPILLIGEGWNFGEVADGARFVQASQSSLSGSGIATFSDRARDAVRGGGCCDSGTALVAEKGWVNATYPGIRRQNTMSADARQRRARADQLRDGLAGYGNAPGEQVSYVENHDNLTLFDINAMKLPAATPVGERARVQILALATVALSQGIAYFHAGGELLRSKSLDRNSFDSGDAFNRLDWSLAGNGFGIGLPPADGNRTSWPVMRAVLADSRVSPTPDTIRWTRDAFLDLLRIRSSTTLLRLPSADAIRARLHLVPATADDDGAVVAAWLDGAGLPAARWQRLAYVLNADTKTRQVRMPELAGHVLQLHPVQASAMAADTRPRQQAAFDPALGQFTVPARSVVVYVQNRDQ